MNLGSVDLGCRMQVAKDSTDGKEKLIDKQKRKDTWRDGEKEETKLQSRIANVGLRSGCFIKDQSVFFRQ